MAVPRESKEKGRKIPSESRPPCPVKFTTFITGHCKALASDQNYIFVFSKIFTWWAIMESNHGPRHYQCRALTS